jgi:hypothetical protein
MAEEMSFAEKIKTLNIGIPSHRGPKKTTDDHGTHRVTVTEHWNDRVDVTVKPPTVHRTRS